MKYEDFQSDPDSDPWAWAEEEGARFWADQLKQQASATSSSLPEPVASPESGLETLPKTGKQKSAIRQFTGDETGTSLVGHAG